MCFTSFGDRIIRNTKPANIASIFMTCLPRTWASSYQHNENFMKKPQGMSRASQVKRSSPANRISLFFVARTARWLVTAGFYPGWSVVLMVSGQFFIISLLCSYLAWQAQFISHHISRWETYTDG